MFCSHRLILAVSRVNHLAAVTLLVVTRSALNTSLAGLKHATMTHVLSVFVRTIGVQSTVAAAVVASYHHHEQVSGPKYVSGPNE